MFSKGKTVRRERDSGDASQRLGYNSSGSNSMLNKAE